MRAMSRPGHYCDVTVVGELVNFTRSPAGHITGWLLQVDTGEETLIPVIPGKEVAGFQRGMKLWIRGVLRWEKIPGERYGLLYLWPRHLEVVKKSVTSNEKGVHDEPERVSETRP
jgi:hypothetical protein